MTKSYRPLQATLEGTAVPKMLRGEDWEAGRGVDVHLTLAAVLDFETGARRWPRLHNKEDVGKVVVLAEGLLEDRHGTEGACWSQGNQYGFPTGEQRDVCADTVSRYAHLFPTGLTGLTVGPTRQGGAGRGRVPV